MEENYLPQGLQRLCYKYFQHQHSQTHLDRLRCVGLVTSAGQHALLIQERQQPLSWLLNHSEHLTQMQTRYKRLICVPDYTARVHTIIRREDKINEIANAFYYFTLSSSYLVFNAAFSSGSDQVHLHTRDSLSHLGMKLQSSFMLTIQT